MSEKRIGINDLMEMKGPIWIKNTSDRKYKGGSEVLIMIQQDGAGGSMLTVPRTFLPMEATRRFPRDVLLKSRHFMDALDAQLITIISVKEAEKLEEGPLARREKQRLAQLEEAIRAASTARGIGKNVMISTGDPEMDAQLEAQANGEKPKSLSENPNAFVEKRTVDLNEEDEDEKISAQFRAWVLKLNSFEDEEDAMLELKNNGQMEIDEAVYLMKNVTHEAISERIRKRLLKLGELPSE